ncbi:MAG: hypothetical protein MI922_14395 [Bacteroidales bacterium]|nr:hypothetical protein [Bacteroidales bacterium]
MRPIHVLVFLMMMILAPSCSNPQKAAKERRNYMMPHTNELPRNYKHAKAKKKRKTHRKTKIK